jgi:hypothetical protein
VHDLYGSKKSEALASLIALFMRANPKKYNSIPILENNKSSLWLDVNLGHVCLKLESIIDRKKWLMRDENWVGRNPLRIPLPLEISQHLKELSAISPNASTLGDLFGGHLAAIEKSTRKYLKQISTTSHRITLGKV